MNLFIIGNGFDIAHDLPTKYWDFRLFLENKYTDFLENFERNYNIYYETSNEEKNNILWSNFENNLYKIKEDDIINLESSIYLHLEDGDVFIEEFLYEYFRKIYNIDNISKYLEQWIKTININKNPKTSFINKENNDIFLNFNYTHTLETIYQIKRKNIIYIHGSVNNDGELVIGHRNKKCIYLIEQVLKESEKNFDEKKTAICKAIKTYYVNSLKKIEQYIIKLECLNGKQINKIYVIGHSLNEIDIPYFLYVDNITNNIADWIVYFFEKKEIEIMKKNLLNIGIEKERIQFKSIKEFYDL